jgi:hypothetical protein
MLDDDHDVCVAVLCPWERSAEIHAPSVKQTGDGQGVEHVVGAVEVGLAAVAHIAVADHAGYILEDALTPVVGEQEVGCEPDKPDAPATRGGVGL